MHATYALKLIGKAVDLADSGFTGDALEEVCRCEDQVDREAVCCIVRARLEMAHVTPKKPRDTIEAVRSLGLH